MHQDVERILLTEEELAKRVKELGEEISRDYAGQSVTLIGVLKGAVVFFSDIMRAITVPAAIDFIACSSYGMSSTTSGEVQIRKDLDHSIEGKHVIVIEDIVDTGTTLHYLLDNLKKRGAASVKLAALLNKPSRRKVEVTVDYTGFEVPDYFVVGYGLDYAEKYRNLPYIGILKESVYKK